MIVDEGYLDKWNYFESEIGFGIEKPKEASMRHAWGWERVEKRGWMEKAATVCCT